jgi:hypothetical protein
VVRLEPFGLERGDQVLAGVAGALDDAELFVVGPVEERDAGIGEVLEGRIGGAAVPYPAGAQPLVFGSGEAFVRAVPLPRQVVGERGGESTGVA